MTGVKPLKGLPSPVPPWPTTPLTQPHELGNVAARLERLLAQPPSEDDAEALSPNGLNGTLLGGAEHPSVFALRRQEGHSEGERDPPQAPQETSVELVIEEARAEDDPAPPAVCDNLFAIQAETAMARLGAPSPQEPVATSDTTQVIELAETLADRILVGRAQNGQAEIRVSLRGEALGQTEIIITRADGGISIRLEPGSASAGQVLYENVSALTERLAERLGERVSVELQPAQAGSREGDRQDRRSRGHEAILRYVADPR